MDEMTTTETKNLYQLLEQFEKDLITWALTKARGNVAMSSRLLTINRTTLIFKLKKYQIPVASFL